MYIESIKWSSDMQAIQLALCLHVLAGVFWAGSTMALAAVSSTSRRFFAMQMVTALLVVCAGTYLWHTLHDGAWGAAERVLAAGAVSAVAALLIQGAVIGSAIGEASRSEAQRALLGARIRNAHRVAAALLAVAATAMAASRFA
jgi:uncharacterized membrane protein